MVGVLWNRFMMVVGGWLVVGNIRCWLDTDGWRGR